MFCRQMAGYTGFLSLLAGLTQCKEERSYNNILFDDLLIYFSFPFSLFLSSLLGKS